MIALEFAWLAGSRRMPPLDAALALLPGALLLLALRAALADAAWPWIAVPLAASFPIHLWDLARRGTARRGS